MHQPEPEPEPVEAEQHGRHPLYAGDTGDLQVALRLSKQGSSTHQISWAGRELERYLLHSASTYSDE
jgi:hypothetical protein